jgi:pyridoxamine 5'-phosphate oxidase
MMSLTPWRSCIDRSLNQHNDEPQARYFQIATIDHLGYPTNRTVVFRGFMGTDNVIKFITDRRSRKVAHIAQKPWGEICWYFANTREQYRIAGILTVVGADHDKQELVAARNSTWQSISEATRSQFLWADPGKPLQTTPEFDAPPIASATEPVANFCLVLLQPWRVDHLQLLEPQQKRSIYRRDRQGHWSHQQVNP